jgi:hypothetical protein
MRLILRQDDRVLMCRCDGNEGLSADGKLPRPESLQLPEGRADQG